MASAPMYCSEQDGDVQFDSMGFIHSMQKMFGKLGICTRCVLAYALMQFNLKLILGNCMSYWLE